MFKAVTTKQIQTLDRITIEKFGIPSVVLMENAGRAVAEHILNYLKPWKNKMVSIICGTGNNGGDGLVVARHLHSAGIKVYVLIIGKLRNLKEDPQINYWILKKMGLPVLVRQKLSLQDMKAIRKSEMIIDALFGVGLNRIIQEPFRSAIEFINREAKRIASIDIPSGLDATTGKIYGVCVKAGETVTFTYLKKGFFIGEGRKYAGKVKVVDIGIPEKVKRLVIK